MDGYILGARGAKHLALRTAHHVSQPRYLLTVTLEPTADSGTLVGWNQDFENPDVGRRMERILVPANEQLLDRLSAEVLREHGGG